MAHRRTPIKPIDTQSLAVCLLSLLPLVSLMSQLSRCQMYFHTALLQLQTIVDMFVLVCLFESISNAPIRWYCDHGLTYVGALAKTNVNILSKFQLPSSSCL